jgi:FAD/FMN-containing dehydrogenase
MPDERTLTRRELLARGAAGATAVLLPGALAGCAPRIDAAPVRVNDVHSRLNETLVAKIERPATVEELRAATLEARRARIPLSISGGRHAMGGQQFGRATILLDTTGLTGVLDFDAEQGEVEVGAGIQWPDLVDWLVREQEGAARAWGIVQKQTGADRLCVGGALAANAHGRGLAHKPIVQDVAAFTLMNAEGELVRCSRTENAELFRLAIGGYGLFGPMTSVRLRLAPRRKVERVVEVVDTKDVMRRFDERIAEGFLYGDCQYSTDLASDSGLRRGVFSCYRPVADDTPIPAERKELSADDWKELVALAHTDRAAGFEKYTRHYLATSGQIYWSDVHQLSTYVRDYHAELAERLGADARGSEMITEIYTPRDALASFLERVRADFLEHGVELVYGTIRLIEKDDETFLPWAKDRFACVIFNLHVDHDRPGLAKAEEDFRRLIDRGIEHGGGYFLTYHRWASRRQVLACYPELPEFLRRKREHDPGERFQSEWYRHYRTMFADLL